MLTTSLSVLLCAIKHGREVRTHGGDGRLHCVLGGKRNWRGASCNQLYSLRCWEAGERAIGKLHGLQARQSGACSIQKLHVLRCRFSRFIRGGPIVRCLLERALRSLQRGHGVHGLLARHGAGRDRPTKLQ